MLVTFVEKNKQMVLTNEKSQASRAAWIQIAADLNLNAARIFKLVDIPKYNLNNIIYLDICTYLNCTFGRLWILE